MQSQEIPKDKINTNHIDKNDNDSNGIRTWFGSLIKSPDRLTYN